MSNEAGQNCTIEENSGPSSEALSFPNHYCLTLLRAFPGDTVVKNLPINAGDARDSGSIPESEDPPEEERATPSSVLAWRIPWIAKDSISNEKDKQQQDC